MNKKWKLREWDGPAQYEDEETGELMMLPTGRIYKSAARHHVTNMPFK
jgi:hypothetical protein